MTVIAIVLTGALIAAILDWAVYTHLSAYMRASFRLNQHLDFSDLLRTAWQRARFALVILAGVLAGLSFATQNPILWLVSLAVFLVGHGIIYRYIFARQGE